ELSGPGGSIIINREGITLVGDVYIEGELCQEGGAPDMVSTLKLSVNEEFCPDCLGLRGIERE
ncbi:hypothetical protein D3M74_06150, partial [Rodentibacter pneumotropicus]